MEITGSWPRMIILKKVHKGKLAWHYTIRSILINTKDAVTNALISMHDSNKATENSHVKSNLIHTLHWMQTVGKLDLVEFKNIMTAQEYKQAKADNAKTDKKTWYHIPQSRFLEYLHSISSLCFSLIAFTWLSHTVAWLLISMSWTLIMWYNKRSLRQAMRGSGGTKTKLQLAREQH